MLPRKHRIQRKDFPTGPRQGFRVFSPLFSGVIYPSASGARVAVVVSKKTTKTAIARNTLRRRLYAATSPFLGSFSRGALVVLHPKIEAQKAPFATLKSEIEAALRKARVL